MVKRKKSNNRGSAMLVAVITSIVVIAFCLSLLLVAYSLFASCTKKALQNEVKEMAKSVSLSIAEELTQPNFATLADMQAGENNTGSYPLSKNSLWYYVRYNIQQENGWPYYVDETTFGHTGKFAKRYFTYKITGGDESKYNAMADDISVCMYWEPMLDGDKDGTILVVTVQATKGDASAKVTCYYELTVSEFADGKMQKNITKSFSMNPKNNYIDGSENWRWTKVDQE